MSSARSRGDCRVAGGTAWLWARPEAQNTVDVLFVDEAAQMSLANVLAVSPAAAGLVLIGDPQQLEQPIQGSHPGWYGGFGSGSSAGRPADYRRLIVVCFWNRHGDCIRTYARSPARCSMRIDCILDQSLENQHIVSGGPVQGSWAMRYPVSLLMTATRAPHLKRRIQFLPLSGH